MSAEQKTVWTIESGEYSDYRVDGVYSSREHAEAVVAKLRATGPDWRGDDYRLVERELDPGVEALRKGYKRFYVWMLFDGTVESIREDDGWEVATSFEVWRRSTAPVNRGKNVPDCLNATLFARDEQHAIKIVNEQRAQMIATGKWPEVSP